MAIKKLQNNFTTSEQSKRLLELGIPVDSADCYYETFEDKFPQIVSTAEELDCLDDLFLPCWSVGRLIEIALICATTEVKPYINFSTSKGWYATNNIEYMISIFNNYSNNYMDFSKLEE
jgi:hypothetical protein